MDYSVLIWSVCLFVESRVRGEINLEELAMQSGFSLAHIREVFRRNTGKTFSCYVQERKIACAAQELLHTNKEIMEVAMDYGFSGRDVFSRAFKRCTGYTPTEFRTERPILARVKLCAGVHGPALPHKEMSASRKGKE